VAVGTIPVLVLVLVPVLKVVLVVLYWYSSDTSAGMGSQGQARQGRLWFFHTKING
jgi:hypothetical protein